jgi:hypothetical protein
MEKDIAGATMAPKEQSHGQHPATKHTDDNSSFMPMQQKQTLSRRR